MIISFVVIVLPLQVLLFIIFHKKSNNTVISGNILNTHVRTEGSLVNRKQSDKRSLKWADPSKNLSKGKVLA